MAKRVKQRFSAMSDNEPKSLQREETKGLEIPTAPSSEEREVTQAAEAIAEPVKVEVKPVFTKPKKIARNYNYEGDLLEKFDAILWHKRKMATVVVNDALRKAMKAIPREEMEAAMKAYHESEAYKERGPEYYYKEEE